MGSAVVEDVSIVETFLRDGVSADRDRDDRITRATLPPRAIIWTIHPKRVLLRWGVRRGKIVVLQLRGWILLRIIWITRMISGE